MGVSREREKKRSNFQFREISKKMQVHQKTFAELDRLPIAQFLEQLGIGFYKHSVVENYKLTRDKLGTGINGSVIRVQRRSDNTLGASKIIYKMHLEQRQKSSFMPLPHN